MEEAETLKAAIDSGRYDYATLATQIGKSETYIALWLLASGGFFRYNQDGGRGRKASVASEKIRNTRFYRKVNKNI